MKKPSLVCFIGIMFPIIASASTEVRNLIPPKLENINLGRKVIVHVPKRAETPNMSIEKIGNKVVAHNYGHGIMAWSLAPASAVHVNSMLINSFPKMKPKKDTPITVVGGGVIGMFSAYNLHKRGFTDITVIAESFNNLPSQNTSGLIHVVSVSNDPTVQRNIEKMALESYKFYNFVAKNKHSIFRNYIVSIPAYFDSKEKSGLEAYVKNVIKPAKDVIVDFGNGIKKNMVVYDDAIFVNVEQVMNEMLYYLKLHKVKFLTGVVNNFSEINSNFIVNCSGIGARKLTNDNTVVELKEYLVMLRKQKSRNLHYMMFVTLNETKTRSGKVVKHSLYMLPKTPLSSDPEKNIGLIGGEINEDVDFLSGEEFNVIIQGAKNFYYNN